MGWKGDARLVRRGGGVSGGTLLAPVRVRSAVLHEPLAQDLPVPHGAKADPLVEGPELSLQRGEGVAGNPHQVVVLEVEVGVNEDPVPEPALLDQGGPLGGITGIRTDAAEMQIPKSITLKILNRATMGVEMIRPMQMTQPLSEFKVPMGASGPITRR